MKNLERYLAPFIVTLSLTGCNLPGWKPEGSPAPSTPALPTIGEVVPPEKTLTPSVFATPTEIATKTPITSPTPVPRAAETPDPLAGIFSELYIRTIRERFPDQIDPEFTVSAPTADGRIAMISLEKPFTFFYSPKLPLPDDLKILDPSNIFNPRDDEAVRPLPIVVGNWNDFVEEFQHPKAGYEVPPGLVVRTNVNGVPFMLGHTYYNTGADNPGPMTLEPLTYAWRYGGEKDTFLLGQVVGLGQYDTDRGEFTMTRTKITQAVSIPLANFQDALDYTTQINGLGVLSDMTDPDYMGQNRMILEVTDDTVNEIKGLGLDVQPGDFVVSGCARDPKTGDLFGNRFIAVLRPDIGSIILMPSYDRDAAWDQGNQLGF